MVLVALVLVVVVCGGSISSGTVHAASVYPGSLHGASHPGDEGAGVLDIFWASASLQGGAHRCERVRTTTAVCALQWFVQVVREEKKGGDAQRGAALAPFSVSPSFGCS